MNIFEKKTLDGWTKKKKNVVGWTKDYDGTILVFLQKKYDTPTAQRLINNSKVNFWKKDLVPKTFRRGFKQRVTKTIDVGDVKAYGLRSVVRPPQNGVEISPVGRNWVGTLGWQEKKSFLTLRNKRIMLNKSWERMLKTFNISFETKWVGVTNKHVSDGNKYLTQPYNDFKKAYEVLRENLDSDCALLLSHVGGSFDTFGGGRITNFKDAKEGMAVTKTGRTTGKTKGVVIATGVNIRVDMGGFTHLFKDMVMCTDMSAPGDSGSAITEQNTTNAVALLNSGSNKYTFGIPVSRVRRVLGLV